MRKLIDTYNFDERELNKKIMSGEINPIHLPDLVTLSDVVKYQFCSDIINYKKSKNLKQNELAVLIALDKSEISKLCSYSLKDFSQERLMGIVEMLILKGASIDLQASWEKIKIGSKKIQKSLKEKSREKVVIGAN